MPTQGDRPEFPVNPSLDEAIHSFEEVVAVELRMKAQDRTSEEAADDLFLEGANAERLGVRPRYVPEGDDRGARQPLFQQARQDRKVIILHEDDRLLRRRLPRNRIGEQLIDFVVRLPVRLAKMGRNE